ncbi:MAG: hypothetical protein ACD_58C00287G0009 [uncultured bacterium]|nr:MAG: hypothetical protein ACD_58C00287G0009 [uncultured bacterium]
MIKSIIHYSQLEDRLDAEYYKPEFLEVESCLNKLRITQKLAELACSEQLRYNPQHEIGIIKYLDIANVDLNSGSVTLQLIPRYLAPSRARRRVNVGDILISMVRPNRNAIVLIGDNLKDIVCSTGFTVVKPQKIKAGYLFAFLKTKYAIKQLTRSTSAVMYPAISEQEVFEIKVPVPDKQTQDKISDSVKQSINIGTVANRKFYEAQNLLYEYLNIRNDKTIPQKTFSIPFSQLEDRLDGEYYRQKSILFSPIFSNGALPLGKVTSINMGKTPSKTAYTKKGVRILKVRDLTNKGINWTENNRAFVTSEAWEKSEKSRVQKNDILLISAAHQAYYIGKELDIVFDIPKKYSNKLSAVAELLIIRSTEINPYVLLWYLRSPIAYKLIQQQITGETSHLYPKDLVNLPIPKILFDFNKLKQLEQLTKDSILLQKQSKELLESAKLEVEKVIEGSKNGNC